MKIKSIKTHLLRVPMDKVYTDSINDVGFVDAPLVRIETDVGIDGWGFNWNLAAGTEFSIEMIDRYMASKMIGKDPMNRKKIVSDLFFVENFAWDFRLGRNGLAVMALCMVDMALWDILCKKADLPLWKVLGGYHERLEAYNSFVGYTSASWNIEQLVSDVKELVFRQGYRGVKLFIGRESPEVDLERLKAVRSAVGNSTKVMIDANTKYDLETAIRWGRRFDDYEPFWFEEPLNPLDIRSHIVLRSKIDTPIALGESIHNIFTLRDYVTQGALDILQLDVTKGVGITEWLEGAALAEMYNINVCPHTNIQQAVHVQLAAATRNATMVENMPMFLDVWKNPLQPKDGYFELPQASGAGTEVREDAIQKYGMKLP